MRSPDSPGGLTQIWDVAGKMLYEGEDRAGAAWLPEIDGRKLLVESTTDGLTSRVLEMDTATGKVTAHPAARPPISIPGGAIGDIVNLYGRPTLLSVYREQLHHWNLASLLMGPNAEPRLLSDGLPLGRVQSLAAPAEDSTRFYAAGINEVVAFDTRSGAVRWRTKLNANSALKPIQALSTVPGAGLVLVALDDGVIHVLNGADGAISQSIKTGLQVLTHLQVSTYGGHPVAYITGRDGGVWSVGLWDLASGQRIRTEYPYALAAGAEDKQLNAFALRDGPDGAHFAFASSYSKVMVANYRKDLRQPFPPFEEWHFREELGAYTHSLAIGTDGDTPMLVAGTEDGGLASWNFASGERRGAYFRAHARAVLQICFAKIKGQSVLVSGGIDGIVRLWTPKLEPLHEIDVGEPIAALVDAGNGRLAVGANAGVLLIDLGA